MPATAIDRLYGLTTSVAVKPPCRVGTTINVTLSGLQTIDGVVLAANDRVLVKNQTDATTNGIYEANTSRWSRAPDFDGPRDTVDGTLVIVRAGSANSNTIWELTTANPVRIGSDALTFQKAVLSDTATAAFVAAGVAAVLRTAQDKMRDRVSVMDFGAIGDGTSHPLSERYASLAAAQVDYPHAVALTDQIDWAAWQAAANYGGQVDVPRGQYLFNRKLKFSNGRTRFIGPAASWSGEANNGAEILVTADAVADFIVEARSTAFGALRSVGLTDVGINLLANLPDCGGLAVYGAYDASNFARINITGVALNRVGLLVTAGNPDDRTSVTQTATLDSIWALKRAGVSTAPAMRLFGIQESQLNNLKASHSSATHAACELISCAGTKLGTPSFVNPTGYGLDIIENHGRNEGVTIDTPTFENCKNTVRTYTTDAYMFGSISSPPAVGTAVRQPADGSTATGVVWQSSAAGVYVKDVTGTFAAGTLYDAAGVSIGTVSSLSLFGNRGIELFNPRTLGAATVGSASGGSFKALRNSRIELPDDSNSSYAHTYSADDTATNNQFIERRKGQMQDPGKYNGVDMVADLVHTFPTNWPFAGQTVNLTAFTDARRVTFIKSTAASFLTVQPNTDTVNEYGNANYLIHQGGITFRRTGAATWVIERVWGRVFVSGVCRLSTVPRFAAYTATTAVDANTIDGATATNAGATGTVSLNLSAIGTAVPVGTQFKVVRVANFAFRVDPGAADTILGASAAGKYLELSAVGSSVTLECIDANTYAVVASSGTYSFEP